MSLGIPCPACLEKGLEEKDGEMHCPKCGARFEIRGAAMSCIPLEVKTAAQWDEDLGTHIVDWDGFENRDPSGMMTRAEFERRSVRASRMPPKEITPKPTGTEARVCADIAKRQAHGLAKYGTTVADNPLSIREWLNHAYEECLDQAVYLRRAMDEIDLQTRRLQSEEQSGKM